MPLPGRLAPVVCFTLLLIAALACSTLGMGDNERFIQGTWTQGTDNGDGRGTYMELRFTPGHFTMLGYPPLEHSGRYRVIENTGDTMTVEFTHQSGDLPTDDREVLLILDRVADTLLFDGGPPFQRSGT